jgi:hypothetical protein
MSAPPSNRKTEVELSLKKRHTDSVVVAALARELAGSQIDTIDSFTGAPTIRALPLQIHNDPLVLLCYKKSRRQQGHLGRERAKWAAMWRRRVAIEDGLCRSVRTGSAAGRVRALHAG